MHAKLATPGAFQKKQPSLQTSTALSFVEYIILWAMKTSRLDHIKKQLLRGSLCVHIGKFQSGLCFAAQLCTWTYSFCSCSALCYCYDAALVAGLASSGSHGGTVFLKSLLKGHEVCFAVQLLMWTSFHSCSALCSCYAAAAMTGLASPGAHGRVLLLWC
jgi:hypothetical protein